MVMNNLKLVFTTLIFMFLESKWEDGTFQMEWQHIFPFLICS